MGLQTSASSRAGLVLCASLFTLQYLPCPRDIFKILLAEIRTIDLQKSKKTSYKKDNFSNF